MMSYIFPTFSILWLILSFPLLSYLTVLLDTLCNKHTTSHKNKSFTFSQKFDVIK